MSTYKEIVTKTIVGKGKKNFVNNYKLTTEETPDTILGCWIINHHFRGSNKKNEVTVNGTFDINVWYSHDNDSKTSVSTKTFDYEELLRLRVKDYDSLTNNNEIIVRSIKHPTVQDVKIINGEVNLTVNKELGVEIVGESKVKIATLEDELPWDDIEDDSIEEVNENYLNEDN